MSNFQTAKQRFEIIGNDPKLNRAIEKALRVGPTDISVLITGESGVGKEAMPKIIHRVRACQRGRKLSEIPASGIWVHCRNIAQGAHGGKVSSLSRFRWLSAWYKCMTFVLAARILVVLLNPFKVLGVRERIDALARVFSHEDQRYLGTGHSSRSSNA